MPRENIQYIKIAKSHANIFNRGCYTHYGNYLILSKGGKKALELGLIYEVNSDYDKEYDIKF
jgi:hypothetical protein